MWLVVKLQEVYDFPLSSKMSILRYLKRKLPGDDDDRDEGPVVPVPPSSSPEELSTSCAKKLSR